MANTIDLNVSPYYDDFNPSKDYLRVLFRPGFTLQAREVNTLQSFLQEQIKRHGDYIFKDGSKVTDGAITFDNNVTRLAITGQGNASYPPANAQANTTLSVLDIFVGKIITDASHTVKAQVLALPTTTTGTASVGDIYIKYLSDETFSATGGYVYALAADNPGLAYDAYQTFSVANDASICTVLEGVYYIRGHFTRIPEQIVVVDSSGTTPTKEVGFTISSDFVTQNEDASLYDIARGSPNEGAPGAHRFKQTVSFVVKDVDEEVSVTFYSVIRVIEGVVQSGRSGTNPQLAELGDTMARRTFDESGHYTVEPFTAYVSNIIDSDEKYNVNISKGKAYVAGYEHVIADTITRENDKALETNYVSNHKITVEGTTSVDLVSTNGGTLPGTNGTNTSTYANRLQLRDASNNPIGLARAYGYFDIFEKGQAKKKLYLYDVKFFQVVTLDEGIDLIAGNDVEVGNVTGYAHTVALDVSWLAANQRAVISASGRIPPNQTLRSNVADSETNVTAVTAYGWDDVVTITDIASTFIGTVAATPNVTSGALLKPLDTVIETAKDAGGPFDNSVTFLEHTGVISGNENGEWNEIQNDDVDEVTKTLSYRYLHVKNYTGDRSGINFGWLAKDKHIHLGAVDIQRVFKITKSLDNTFANGQFQRLNITTAGVIPQGTILRGKLSGNKCIVALSNTTVVGAGDLSAGSGYHEYKSGTGSSATIEVVWEKGSKFTANEELVAITPAGIVDYTPIITYTSVNSEIGEDYTNMFLVDSGQRDEYYDVGRLVRKANQQPPADAESFVIFYSYYEANPSLLGYYNADSYGLENYFIDDVRYINEPYEIIKPYKSNGIDLRNCWDFRLRLNGVTTNIASSPFLFQNRTFYDQPRVKPRTNFTTDFKEYLPRNDLITLDEKGNIRFIKGIPAKKGNVRTPTVPARSMAIAIIENDAAARYVNEGARPQIIDNKRFTMRDIGKLAEKIDNVEKAVALSLLEAQALSDNIEDRERIGFITDDFSNLDATFADLEHAEFNASYNTLAKELTPATTAGEPVPVSIASTSGIDSHYLANGYIVKEYTEELMLKQLDVTGDHLINPFNTWIYDGITTLTPAKQFWKETTDSFFVKSRGQTTPFLGDSEAFWSLSRITRTTPAGFSNTLTQWTGINGSDLKQNIRINTTSTLSGVVQPFPAGHKMQPITIGFVTTGLKPNTPHTVTFSGDPATNITGTVRPTFTTDSAGKVSGTIGIPRDTYNIGDHVFNISSADYQTSYSNAIFNSSGYFQEREVSLVITDVDPRPPARPASIATAQWRPRVRRPRRRNCDPIAQTFMLPAEDNVDPTQILTNQVTRSSKDAFVTSVDIWFTEIDTRANMNRVIVEIREVVNGYPSDTNGVLGEAELDVDVNTYSQVNGSQVITDAMAVNFKFNKPVRLKGDKEYSIVILSPSNRTKVCIAEIGEKKVGTNGIHDAQPNVGGHYGSFFVSQNSSTWNAVQTKDMTFRIYRADFGKGSDDVADSTVTLNNLITNGFGNSDLYAAGTEPVGFRADIGNINNGLCFETFAFSNYVKVYHPNHGMHYDGALVVIWGLDQTYPSGGAKVLNGIPVSEFDLGVTENDFQTTTSTHRIYYPTIDSYFIKTTTKATESGLVFGGIGTCATQDIAYSKMISNLNAIVYDGTEVTQKVRTATTNSADLTVLNNKVDNNDLRVVTTDQDVDIAIGSVHTFSDPKIVRAKVNAASNVDFLSTITLKSNNRYSSPVIFNGKNLEPIAIRSAVGNLLDDSDIEMLLTREVTVLSTDDQILEFTSYQSALQSNTEHNAYVTKEINVDDAANTIELFFDADMQPGASIEFFYKAKANGDDTPLSTLEWEPFKQSQNITEKNYGSFSSDPDYRQFSATETLAKDINYFKIKMKMSCTNEAQIPTIKDLRILATYKV